MSAPKSLAFLTSSALLEITTLSQVLRRLLAEDRADGDGVYRGMLARIQTLSEATSWTLETDPAGRPSDADLYEMIECRPMGKKS